MKHYLTSLSLETVRDCYMLVFTHFCDEQERKRENRRAEVAKSYPTILSGRDLKLQKKTFPITRHSEGIQ